MTKLTTFLRKLLQIRCMLALGNCFQKLLHIRRPEMKLFIIPLNYVITNLVKTSRCKSQACQFQTGMYLNALIFLEKVFIPKKRGEGARSGSHGLTSQVFNSYPDTPVLGSAGWAWLTPVSECSTPIRHWGPGLICRYPEMETPTFPTVVFSKG